jgi:nitroreductase
MELTEALRSTGAIREYTSDSVSDETLARVLDTARFAPSGGNRQGWRVVVVADASSRQRLRDLYLEGWYQYLALGAAGLVPWAPVTDRRAEAEALTNAPEFAQAAAAGPGGFAEHLDQAPVILLVFVDLGALAAIDRDLPRYTFAGGASVYPFCWNLLLAARQEGLGGVMTTMAVRAEEEVKQLVRAPEDAALAALVTLGYPVHRPSRLRRRPVAEFATVDHWDGPAFSI